MKKENYYVLIPIYTKIVQTRMHPSRMRTAHSLTVSRSIRGGDCIQEGVCPTNPLDADTPPPSFMQTPPP